jgi:hypothetical protein
VAGEEVVGYEPLLRRDQLGQKSFEKENGTDHFV